MNTKKSLIWGFIGLALGGFMANLDFSIVTVVLPSIQQHFNTTISNIMWVNLIFSLVSTSVLIPISKFGDMFGRKKILLLCLSIFILSSVLCGIAPSLGILILGRGFQALGASALMSISIPLALDLFPSEKRNGIAAIWGGFIGVALAIGPSLGGYIGEYLNWRYIFFINVPIGILCFLLILKFINESSTDNCSKSIDYWGILTLAITLSSFTYATTKGNDFGFTSRKILALFLICLVSFIIFLFVENKTSNPVIDFSIFKIKSFTISSILIGIICVVTVISFNFINFYFKSISKFSTLESGNILFFLALGLIVSSLIAGKLAKKIKISIIVFFSIIICIVAIVLLTSISTSTSKTTFMLFLFVSGFGIGAPSAQLIAAALADVPNEKNGLASGINSLIQKIFILVLTAIMTCSLTTNLNNAFDDTKKDLISHINSSQILDKKTKDLVVTKLNTINKSNYEEVEKEINDELQKNSSIANSSNITLAQKKHLAENQKELIKIMKTAQSELMSNSSDAFTNTFKIGFIFLAFGLILCLFI